MNGWEFQPARDRELRGIERHRSLVRENGLASSVARLFWWTILRAMLRVWHRPRVTGRENLPASPPFILISNHTSHLDTMLLASLLPTKWRDDVFPIAASDVFFGKRPIAAFAAWFLNALAIRRTGIRSHDLEEMRERLTRDHAVFIVFPEGTRSRTGEMQKFQSGIGRLVANSAVPVVPCHLEGCFRALPPGSRFPKPLSLAVTVGKPIRFDDCPDNRTGWDAIAARLQVAVEGFADHP